MSTLETPMKSWVAPGPGLWERDAAHQERPFSRLWLDACLAASAEGMADAFARFGIPLSGMQMADVEGWFFATPSPVDEEAFPERMDAAERAMAERAWRGLADEWHGGVRAEYLSRNRAIQAVDPASLDEAALVAHIQDALGLLHDAASRHFLHAVAHWVGVGLLLREAKARAGWEPERTIQALAGASPTSTAPVLALQQLSEAIARDAGARELLSRGGGDAAATLSALLECPPPVRDALYAYLDEHGWQIFTGFDFTHEAIVELPDLLLDTIRKVGVPVPARADAFDDLRRAAGSDGAHLDTLIDDALVLYGLRDDDSGLTIQRPIGLVRRALLEAGTRLAARSEIHAVDHIFDLIRSEVPSLADPAKRPSADELAHRARRRGPGSPVPPRRLGEEGPPPDGELPPAMDTVLSALFLAMSLEDTPDEEDTSPEDVRGVGASPGVYEGRACVIHGTGDFKHLEPGDVLVASITTPAYNVVLPLLGAVVTDRGGILSHPAIVAREFGIPAVVGTSRATARIPHGARVRVDGGSGVVTLL